MKAKEYSEQLQAREGAEVQKQQVEQRLEQMSKRQKQLIERETQKLHLHIAEIRLEEAQRRRNARQSERDAESRDRDRRVAVAPREHRRDGHHRRELRQLRGLEGARRAPVRLFPIGPGDVGRRATQRQPFANRRRCRYRHEGKRLSLRNLPSYPPSDPP